LKCLVSALINALILCFEHAWYFLNGGGSHQHTPPSPVTVVA